MDEQFADILHNFPGRLRGSGRRWPGILPDALVQGACSSWTWMLRKASPPGDGSSRFLASRLRSLEIANLPLAGAQALVLDGHPEVLAEVSEEADLGPVNSRGSRENRLKTPHIRLLWLMVNTAGGLGHPVAGRYQGHFGRRPLRADDDHRWRCRAPLPQILVADGRVRIRRIPATALRGDEGTGRRRGRAQA